MRVVMYSKVAFAFSTVLLAASIAFTRWGPATPIRQSQASMTAGRTRYEPAIFGRNPGDAATWKEPQSNRSEFRGIDLFSPPAQMVPAREEDLSTAIDETFGDVPGIELLGVEPVPFRLRLSGFVEGKSGFQGAFVSPGRYGTMLAQAGHQFPDFGLVLESFEVAGALLDRADGGAAMAHAVVVDMQSSERTRLELGSTVLTDDCVAHIRLEHECDRRIEVREGDQFEAGEVACLVNRIRTDPDEIELVCETDGEIPRILILQSQRTREDGPIKSTNP